MGLRFSVTPPPVLSYIFFMSHPLPAQKSLSSSVWHTVRLPPMDSPRVTLESFFFSNTFAFPLHTFVFTHNILWVFLLGTAKCIARETGRCWKDRWAPCFPSSKSLTSLSFPFSLSQTLSVFWTLSMWPAKTHRRLRTRMPVNSTGELAKWVIQLSYWP